MPNILDVAKLANVSAGTVSRVLGRHPSVSADNYARVQEAIKILDYSPRQRKISRAAANPLEQKNILLLMLGMGRSLAALPVVASAVEGVEQAINEANANLLIVNRPKTDRIPEVLRRKRIDGVVLEGALQGDVAGAVRAELVEKLRELPAVWPWGGRPASAETSCRRTTTWLGNWRLNISPRAVTEIWRSSAPSRHR